MFGLLALIWEIASKDFKEVFIMKLTREVDIYQCPVSIKYFCLPFGWLKPNTVNKADYVRVWHGKLNLMMPQKNL